CSRALYVAGGYFCAVIPFWSVPCLQLSLCVAPATRHQRKLKGQTNFASDVLFRRSGEVDKRVTRGSVHEWCGSNALGWHAAMLGTSEEDGWCTFFEIKLNSFQQSVAHRDDLYVILHSLTIPDIGTMSCLHGFSSKSISQWIYLHRFYSIPEAPPSVQGEELRKQASVVAYIKCSLETH
uniref:Uncharacterized protein n=1 Tax=Triticum urartu TaxID=4572 RepID=A0A8R7TN19_TRIUA